MPYSDRLMFMEKYGGSSVGPGVAKSKLANLLSGTWQCAFAGALAFVGLVLPMDFFIKLNSLLMSLRPIEIVAVYGVAWILYCGMGLLIGGIVGLAGAGLLILIRKYTRETIRFFALLIIALVLAKALQQGLLAYLGELSGSGKPLAVSSLASRVLVVGVAVWLAWRHFVILTRLRSFLSAVAVCGACAVGLAIVMAIVPSNERRQDSVDGYSQGPAPSHHPDHDRYSRSQPHVPVRLLPGHDSCA